MIHGPTLDEHRILKDAINEVADLVVKLREEKDGLRLVLNEMDKKLRALDGKFTAETNRVNNAIRAEGGPGNFAYNWVNNEGDTLQRDFPRLCQSIGEVRGRLDELEKDPSKSVQHISDKIIESVEGNFKEVRMSIEKEGESRRELMNVVRILSDRITQVVDRLVEVESRVGGSESCIQYDINVLKEKVDVIFRRMRELEETPEPAVKMVSPGAGFVLAPGANVGVQPSAARVAEVYCLKSRADGTESAYRACKHMRALTPTYGKYTHVRFLGEDINKTEFNKVEFFSEKDHEIVYLYRD